MPPRARSVRRRRDLLLGFLDLVLAEVPLAGVPCRADASAPNVFETATRVIVRRTATGAPGGIGDARSDLGEVLGDRLDSRQQVVVNGPADPDR